MQSLQRILHHLRRQHDRTSLWRGAGAYLPRRDQQDDDKKMKHYGAISKGKLKIIGDGMTTRQKRLPVKPSRLILLALKDLEKTERSKKYKADMNYWHVKEGR